MTSVLKSIDTTLVGFIRLAAAVLAFPVAGCGGPVAHVIFCVKDDEGMVVTNARVGMSTIERPVSGPVFGQTEFPRVEGRTDTNGIVSLSLESQHGNLAVHVKPMPDFYYDQGRRLYLTNATGGRWQPWGQTNVLVVRRIVNPIPMYAMSYGGTVPVNGKPAGFDLMKGDWVAPYGKGIEPDFVFLAEWKSFGRNDHRVLRFTAKIDLTFANDGDGIHEVRIPFHAPPRGSVYRMPRLSPEDGFLPCSSWDIYENDDGHSAVQPDDINYFFRVRTKRDANGRVISAHYGKIHGPIQFWVNDSGATFGMRYYMNPIPNDRNTEFDPKRNLLKVEGSRQVIDP